jgi:glycosyltransferase involved in cell wall biosynthesis
MVRVFSRLPKRSYAPELYAYQDYFNSLEGFEFTLIESNTAYSDLNGFDVEIQKMGFQSPWKSPRWDVIHDYASLSTGRCGRLKDLVKVNLSAKPKARIFLSEFVRAGLGFSDSLPFVYRDMGVDDCFYKKPSQGISQEYDFIYAGSISASRHVSTIIQPFCHSDKTLLLVGEPDIDIYREFHTVPNIIFAGKQGRGEVAKLMHQSVYGINITPDIYPYSHQTSTKTLEYAAAGLKIVANYTPWLQRFIDERKAGIYLFEDKLTEKDLKSVEDFQFSIPDVTNLCWSNLLRASAPETLVLL